jgi:hypothetical protein
LEKSVTLLDADNFLPRTTKTGRALVVQSSTADSATLANAEEDLSVMALILRKATGAPRAEDRRVALGIEVDSTVFGSSSGARNIYLDGYGALFLLGVRFPLLPPPEKTEEKDPKLASSDWAQAREEFLSGGTGPAPYKVALEQVWTRSNRQPAEEYDAEKVEELKAALLQALKNATHIRMLKPSDFITVVIQGAEAAPPEKRGGRGSNKGGRTADTGRDETVMTFRVKQPDVTAFAKGSMDLETFRKRAAIQTYTRRGDFSVGTAGFFGPGQ